MRRPPIETVAETVEGLIKEGKVLNWGISEADENTIRKAHAVCPLCAVQNRYSMMARHYESLFACLDELTIGFVAFSPLANGFLSAQYNKDSHFDPKFDYRASMPQFKTENYEKNIDLIQLLNDTAVKHNTTPAVISLAWMMCKKPWIVPIPGTRNLQRLEENAQAAQIKLSAQELQEIDLALNSISMSDVFGGSAFKSKNNK
ncbi:aldo/keto reductase [uncultured Succinatimonas sp.]|uniref:aldo/keto reductase n=1 Tax=uncultured Succinatimonas sp. TaxID=1262973 RepID=UPI0025DA87A6|nr:aldo/keto reductase [uncultured Succinatimonas sp.]